MPDYQRTVRFQVKSLLPQQALRLVEHISEGFKRKRKTVAVFFDIAGVQFALFADDTVLYLRGSNFRQITPRLQKDIDAMVPNLENRGMHTAGDDVFGVNLRPCRLKHTPPTPNFAKQLLQKSFRRILGIQPVLNLHVISYAEMPTLWHALKVFYADRSR
ncbi:hypothetical protein EVAR_9738_1 [Eumeta japonica]|uniref:Uncharacterized protein n=1 Tax=Eumeta variegata TaxID=151549 RepID=A0A4C1U5C4_EUMVA|nr:hypothetical protein EVAR_9738_1 [Eumeta japonica]